MSKYEKVLANKRLLGMDRSERLFRCNAGLAWTGKLVPSKALAKMFGIPVLVKLLFNFVILAKGSAIKLLPPGTPDYCGWKSVVVTEEMVGKTVAVFLAEEHKATPSDKMRKDQKTARKKIVEMGGIHRVVKHDGEVIESCNWR